MDSLPVELLQLILNYCDPPSVRNLRLTTPTLADVGYAYLLPPVFTALPWRDDVARLRNIAGHARLRPSIAAVTLNGTELPLTPDDACQACASARPRALFPLHECDPADLAAALRPLPNLRRLAVTFLRPAFCDRRRDSTASRSTAASSCGHDDGLCLSGPPSSSSSSCEEHVLHGHGHHHPRPRHHHRRRHRHRTPKMNHAAACKSLNVLMAALPGALRPAPVSAETTTTADAAVAGASPPGLTAFSVEGLPLELFRLSTSRRLWFQAAPPVLGASTLTRLDLVLDWTNVVFPASQFKAINGLGYVLRLTMPHLTHLSLAFRRQDGDEDDEDEDEDDYNEEDEDESEGDVSGEAETNGEPMDTSADEDTAAAATSGLAPTSTASPPQRPSRPSRRDRFMLSLGELLGEGGGVGGCGGGGMGGHTGRGGYAPPKKALPAWAALTDLALDGVACDERTLRAFLLRHAATLERLRLGRWTSDACSSASSASGVTLYNGTFGSLLRGLRGGRLPRLQRLQLHGDFDGVRGESVPDADGRTERPWFRAVCSSGSDKNSNSNNNSGSNSGRTKNRSSSAASAATTATTADETFLLPGYTVDSQAFEDYVLGVTDVYPVQIV